MIDRACATAASAVSDRHSSHPSRKPDISSSRPWSAAADGAAPDASLPNRVADRVDPDIKDSIRDVILFPTLKRE
ncbi:MAG: hypothetical protein A2V88_01730 [Elusimicrobia bacterium RBG_16_66_12]|nr:MAG: hypothetical protein A2V88_01730 [Elusimicrobia bacterium RBG_16_66_12]